MMDNELYPYPYPDETLNAIYRAQADLISLENFVNVIVDAVVHMAIWGPRSSHTYIIIIVVCWPWDCPKRTVYYWKYTAHHINEPAQTIPADMLEVLM